MKEIRITKINSTQKIIYYIKKVFPNVSNTNLHKAFRNKDIKVNGKRINDEMYEIKNGDNIQIYIDDMLLFGFPKSLNITYEDDNILVVFKPQGLLSNNEESKSTEPTFEEFVKKEKGENIKICHRLDRNTSGLIVFSKNEQAYECLLDAFKNGYILKEYTACVSGTNFKNATYHYDNYLLKDEKTGFSKVYDTQVPHSVKIITDVDVIKKNLKLDYSILKIRIHTGKTHQIRALMAYISHPIIGDSKYGKNEINNTFKKYRQMLYATKYTFDFPKNNLLSYLNDVELLLDEELYNINP